MRVLTFNSHQPYLHLLASSLPWDFGVVTPALKQGVRKVWDLRIRPLPQNLRIYGTVGAALQDRRWDWILTHNLNDLLDVKDVPLPKAFLIHGTLSGRILQDRSSVDRNSYINKFGILLKAHGARAAYISELKQRDWGIPGVVIRPGIDTRDYQGYRGETRAILQVCNHLKGRGTMMGWQTHHEVCRDLPHLVLGNNPGLQSSRMAESWDDLREQLRSFRVYLYTPVYPYEDGYNLALLEAMTTGMPVATLVNESSPIRDGCEGVVGSCAAELKEKILRLLDDPATATAMGKEARKRVEEQFPLRSFAESWQSFADQLIR